MTQPFIPPVGAPVQLSDFDPRYVAPDWDKKSASAQIAENTAISSNLAYKLYIINKYRSCKIIIFLFLW
jgi:hypothetical protein